MQLIIPHNHSHWYNHSLGPTTEPNDLRLLSHVIRALETIVTSYMGKSRDS